MSEELALRLADEIVATQGAAFVRELLRALKSAGSKVFIGTRKSDTLAHLQDAIRAGLLSYDDLIEWLNAVEGWGHQHIYLYQMSPTLARERFWREPVPDRFVEHARSKGIAIANERKQILAFPDTFRLGRIDTTVRASSSFGGKVSRSGGGTLKWTRKEQSTTTNTVSRLGDKRHNDPSYASYVCHRPAGPRSLCKSHLAMSTRQVSKRPELLSDNCFLLRT